MARGGKRPTAPQNNPMNVNARGGNGQSGDATQAAKYVPDLPYGEGKALMQTQQAASQPIIPLNAPSQRYDEPVTFGANAGPGPGMDALGLSSATERTVADILAEVAQYDTTGEVQALYEQALLGGY